MLFMMEEASLSLGFALLVCSNTQIEEEIFVILLCLLLSHTERPRMLPLSVDLHFK